MKNIVWQAAAIVLATVTVITIAAFMTPQYTTTVEGATLEVLHVNAEVHEVIGTIYNAVPEQCDSSPLITADNSRINLSDLEQGTLKWVALSRDLLKRWGGPYNYGDTIYVHHTDGRLRGKWIVHDTMNKRYKKRVDFLVDKNQNKTYPHRSPHILISNIEFYKAR